MAIITLGNPAVLNPALFTDNTYASTSSSTRWVLTDPTTGIAETFTGFGFSYMSNGAPASGTITGMDIYQYGQLGVTYSGLNVSITQYVSQSGNPDAITNFLVGGDDQIFGSTFGQIINGWSGADTIIALDGDDTVYGYTGDDDVNGNVGADLVYGGDGADFVRGGRDNDTVYGEAGNDPHVNGNIGDDMVFGGTGNDTVFGGQGQDTLHGNEGNDVLSGDLGFDLLYGDAGADRFVVRAGSGLDWAADFRVAEGDKIQLATGTAYTVISLSGQVAIDLGNGDMLGLAGVAAGSFSADWIVFA